MRDRSKSTDSSADPLSVSSLIGQGIYQKLLIVFLCVFISPFMAFNNIPQYLILLEPEFECNPSPYIGGHLPSANISGGRIPSENYSIYNLQTEYPDYSLGAISNLSVGTPISLSVETPINPASLFLELKRQCYMNDRSGVPCQYGYKYKTDFIYPTIISLNDWVCEDSAPKFIAHSLYWLGSIFGVLIIGQVSDK